MGDVKRYNLEDYLGLQIVHEQEDGKFVLYEDHRAVIESIINDEAVLGDHNLIPSYKAEVAALLARHNAMVEAVKSEIAARDHDHFWRCNDATSGEELHENYVALEAARAEVDRLLEDSNLNDHNTYLEACLEDRNAEMMKHVRMYEALEDAVSWLLDIDDAWRVSCTRETDDAWVESQTSFTLARAEINKLLKENNNE